MGLYDKDIRKILLNKFLENPLFINDSSTVIIDELDVCLGASIADIAVINGKIHGFEIKSEHDTLERLETQIEFYNEVFDTVTIVLSSKHLSKAIELIPKWWGIYCVESNDTEHYIDIKKEPLLNNSVSLFNLCQLLWKPELLNLLIKNGVNKGIKSKTRRELARIVANSLEENTIKKYVRQTLKNRETWKARRLQLIHDEKRQSLPS